VRYYPHWRHISERSWSFSPRWNWSSNHPCE